jgi:hypothetical protein
MPIVHNHPHILKPRSTLYEQIGWTWENWVCREEVDTIIPQQIQNISEKQHYAKP